LILGKEEDQVSEETPKVATKTINKREALKEKADFYHCYLDFDIYNQKVECQHVNSIISLLFIIYPNEKEVTFKIHFF